MFKKLIIGVITCLMMIMIGMQVTKREVKNIETNEIVINGIHLNEREMRIHDEFGLIVAGCAADMRYNCELRGDKIINEYVSILENDYEAVVRVVECTTGDTVEYFWKVPK